MIIIKAWRHPIMLLAALGYVHSGPGPGRARHGRGSPVREKKSCTDQSLLKITATFPSVHSSPGLAHVFRAVFAPVAQARFSPVVRVKGLNSLSKFCTRVGSRLQPGSVLVYYTCFHGPGQPYEARPCYVRPGPDPLCTKPKGWG
ncbi:hypothetical protein PoB_004464600 [Plakobranchus ocellatus]|uniref:Secreted protein n=1 Tax=Plakobranchus ocellatus TaxID=259542 RepID=A0AAV4BCK5_9GAST|nr:hypothetical protein PoB_004464600 [Plakobranchus ocellatus]